MNAQHLGPAAVIRTDGFSRSVQPEICPRLRIIFYLRTQGQPHPQIIIHRKIKRGIERPDGARIVARRAQPRAVLGGGAQELVLFLYGRKQVARVTLSGAGQQGQLGQAANAAGNAVR